MWITKNLVRLSVGSLFVLILAMSCGEKPKDKKDSVPSLTLVEGAFMDMKPTDKPKLLAPGLLASSLTEYNGTFNPEGTEFFFTTNTPAQGIISFTRMGADGHWEQPIIAPFSGKYNEYDPLFSPDGSRLYFSSERPIPQDENSTVTNIWYVERDGATWADPVFVELKEEGVENQNGKYYSSLTNDGTIYFNIWNNGDMYKAVPGKSDYKIERLPDVLNSDNGEGDPFISPEEEYIIYRGYNNSLGNGDLYISFKIDEEWTDPENLGVPINSKYHEMCPYVTVDGKYFIFSSSRILTEYETISNSDIQIVREKHMSADNGDQNIYYMSSDFIDEMKAKIISQ